MLLTVDYRHWCAAVEIFCALVALSQVGLVMLVEAPFRICGDTGIEALIATADDIDRPVGRTARGWRCYRVGKASRFWPLFAHGGESLVLTLLRRSISRVAEIITNNNNKVSV